MTTIYLVKDNTHREMENTFFNAKNSLDEHAWNKANMLQLLYLPELKEVHNEFRVAYLAYRKWLIEGMEFQQDELVKGNGRPSTCNDHMNTYGTILGKFTPALLAIDNEAKELADSLNT